MSTSPFIREALDTIAELRAEHRENVENQYRRAEEAINGALLNRRGQERGIDPYSLSDVLGLREADVLILTPERGARLSASVLLGLTATTLNT